MTSYSISFTQGKGDVFAFVCVCGGWGWVLLMELASG